MCGGLCVCTRASHACKNKNSKHRFQSKISLTCSLTCFFLCFVLWNYKKKWFMDRVNMNAIISLFFIYFFFFLIRCSRSRESYWTHRLSLQPRDIQIAAGRRSLRKEGDYLHCVFACVRARAGGHPCVFKICRKRDEALLGCGKLRRKMCFSANKNFIFPTFRVGILPWMKPTGSKYSSEIMFKFFIKVRIFVVL